MGVKDFYLNLEEKWYSIWERIDSKIPVYGIIDRIDSIIPSFALFLLIILFLIFFLFIGFYFSMSPLQASFKIIDYENKPVEDSIINFSIIENGNTIREENIRTNNLGEIIINELNIGQEIIVDINLSKGTSKSTFIVPAGGLNETIKLKQKIVFQSIERNIYLEYKNASVQEAIRMDFFCENNTIIPNPTTSYSQQGTLKIVEPVNCIRLFGKIVSDEYENTQYHINSTSQRITLTKPEPAKAKLKINIRENGLPISNSSFNIKLDGENNYTKLTNNSSETFELVYGTYFLSISDPDRDYGTVTKTIIINKSNTDETIEVSKTIKSKINIIVKDSISGALIENAIVNVKNVSKKSIDEYKTKEDGKAIFAITDKGKLYITAKKAGGIGEGYFVKEIELEEPGLDNNIEIKLSKITTNNAGKTIVKVIDQDNEIVSNARITLRYEKDDSLVELNENQNFVLSDINGYATFLAGKVDDKAYAHASKYPFDGKSNSKTIALEGDNEFEIIMQIGETPIEIIVTNEKGENITGEARLYNLQNEEVSGLMAIENGKVNTKIKAGKIVYLAVNSENHETYYSEPRFLWPNKKEVFQIIINTEISEPKVIADGKLNIFNEQDEIVRTMKAGNKYYTLIRMDSDKTYNNALLHFRAGTEELLENDFIEIDKIETVGNFVEVRGKSYSPQRGYSYDSENLTDSLSKWVTINWNGLTQGTRIVKIHFRIKPNTPSNKELQFFWRASFDDNKKPESNASEELYDDTYASNIYFEGEEAVCITDFCIAHEYLFDTDEQLYLDKPYEIEQIKQYHYQFQIINNSNTDYGTDKKKMGLNLEMISEQGMGAKVIEYTIKDSKNEVSGQSLQSLTDLEIGSFEKNTTINIILTLEGNNSGNSALKIGLKSDGRIIYSNEENFSVPSQKEMSVSLDTSFVPSLINTQIIVDVKNAGEPINEAIIKVFAKEPGFDEYLIEENITNRLGKAQVNSGAHFPSTKVIIEIAKKGYSRKRLELSVSDDIVFYNPTQLSFELNTITKKDEKIVFEIGNATGKKLEIYSIKTNAKFANAINEDALQSYLNGMKGVIIEKDDVEKLDVLMRIQNSLTEDMMIEPINIQGNLIISLRAIETNIIFDTFLPININIGSGAQTGNDCLLLSNVVQSKVTEKGRVTFTFELLNACEANDIPVKIRDLSVTSTSELDGSADLLIQSYSTSKSGRTAIDSMTRTILPEIGGEEKLVGTLTYIPSETAVGKTINIPLTLQAKFQNQIVTSNPSQAKFTVDVINLKECVKIDSSRTPVAFNEESSITIDTTNCLNQKIDIWLCKGNTGCSGGAPEGKISLGKNNFMLQNDTQTITATASDLPGSYGIDVWARVHGKSSFTFIGDGVVAFKEPEGKFFELNKYELNLIGQGMQDTILLTNKMLDQKVKVRATNAVWGKQKPKINWMQIIGGASMGAALGNMIGSNFSRSEKSPINEGTGKTDDTTKTQEPIPPQTNDPQHYNQKYNDYSDQINSSIGASPITGADNFNGGKTTYLYLNKTTGEITGHNTPQAQTSNFEYRGKITPTIVNVGGQPGYYTYNYSGIGSNQTFLNPSTASNHAVEQITTTPKITQGVWSFFNNAPEPNRQDLINKAYNSQITTPIIKNIYSQKINLPSQEWSFAKEFELFKQSNNSSSSASFQATTTRTYAGWGTAIGAIIGGLAGWYMQDQAAKDYLKEFNTASYRDFVIFLQGDNISVSSPDGKTIEEKNIPGDAGALGFSLNEIGVNWDFTNADYSTIENVGLQFSNNGLNEARAKYGTLTINATQNKHGSAIVGNDITSETEYDVTCNKPTFGNYWIGSEEDSGLCTGVSKTNYSQKYHLRVISGEPTGEEASISSSKTCNNGVLTGNTGIEAIPRIKLDWSWNNINENMCDYGNADYAYCDGVQNIVTLVKKLAALQEFFKLNNNTGCPEDPILNDYLSEFDEINSMVELVSEGRIGIEDIIVSVIEDEAIATVKVNNKTGGDIESYVSVVWKGQDEPQNTLKTQTFAPGITELEFTATIDKIDDAYFFTAIANGPSGNNRAVTRAFVNLPPNMGCWAQPTTRIVGGIPSIMYYLANQDTIQWTSKIPDTRTLYEYINFGSYLIRENYSKELFKDTGEYYLNTVFEMTDDTEKAILTKIMNGKIDVVKRFSTQASFEAGLYDAWMNIDFGGDFDLLSDETNIEVSLLMIRSPSEMNPLYKMPFNGLIGENNRANYGTVYTNMSDEELKITNNITTKYNSTGNGIINVKTKKEYDFEKLNSSIGTRGQLAIISNNGSEAEITFTPNYATPVIGKYDLSGTNGQFTFEVERNFSPLTTGGNINFWTGAAKSKNFYGGSAIETYNNTADSQVSDKYGFSWKDTSESGTIYLKTTFYTPTNNSYILKTIDGSFWTPNNNFTNTVELVGIAGMQKNQSGEYFNTLTDLFDMVKNQDVCISNDGATMSFWWNPKRIETTSGSIDNLANKELTIITK